MATLIEFGQGNYDAEPEEFDGKKAVINPNIERLRSNVKTFIEEIKRMSEAHQAGDINVLIPEEKFEGSYRAMAKGVNDMVIGSINVRKKVLACFKEFGEGNFDAEIEQFYTTHGTPINDIVEQVRSNLKGLTADAELLVDGVVGRALIDVRADATKHRGDFRKILRDSTRPSM